MSAHCCDGAGPEHHDHAHGHDPAQALGEALPALQDLADPFLARSLAAYALLAQGRAAEALDGYAALRADSPGAPLQDLVGVMLCEALALDSLGRHDEAIDRRAEAIARIEGAGAEAGAALRGLGEVALYDVALRLVRRAKERLLAGEAPADLAELAELRRRLAAHPALAGSALVCLLGGYAALLGGEREAAAPLLRAALERDPRPVREAARTLRGLGALPADDELAALLGEGPPQGDLVRLGRR